MSMVKDGPKRRLVGMKSRTFEVLLYDIFEPMFEMSRPKLIQAPASPVIVIS